MFYFHQCEHAHHRGMGDILAPDVQQPGAVHQVGKQHGPGSGGLKLAPEIPELILGAPAGQPVGKEKGFPAEEGGPVLPDGADQIHVHYLDRFFPFFGLG